MRRLPIIKALRPFIIFLAPLFSFNNQNGTGDFKISTQNLTVLISGKGEIKEMWIGKDKINKPLKAFTGISGSHTEGDPVVKKLEKGGVEFTRTLINDSLQASCILTERFLPQTGSIRWEIEISGKGKSWGSSINTIFRYPVSKNTRFWTTWGGPQFDRSAVDSNLLQRLVPAPLPPDSKRDEWGQSVSAYEWSDPLISMPFNNSTFYYGAPPVTDENPRIAFIPFQHNLFCIPMCTILEDNDNTGLTISLSPEDNIIDMDMKTKEDGSISFERLHNRISADSTVSFSLDLVAGQSDWRQSLQWISQRYPGYFNPEIPDALKFAGTGAYSGMDTSFDTEKMKNMAFSVNWQASFDFPYMGMFLPPINPNEKWKNYGGNETSAEEMNEYAGNMKKRGFYVFNYFNVTEFGANVKFPQPQGSGLSDSSLWKNCNDFLYERIPGSLLLVPNEMNLDSAYYSKTKNGGPYYTWGDGIVTDCGDPAYKDFLLAQARRHISEIPNSFGICIDRMDWLRFFNEKADDGVSWFDGKPVRSLNTSWKQLLDSLGSVMHGANKAILVNNLVKRVDLMKHVDGIFDEYAYAGSPLNTTAFLSLNKPAMGWTSGARDIRKTGVDNFFQKYLYLGVFPMCPFPGNDHSIKPDPEIDKWYLDYGPLMIAMKGRKWVLEPHVISVKDNLAKANLFLIPKGLYIPVVYAKKGTMNIIVTFKNVGGGKIKSCQVYSPGKKEPTTVEFTANKGNITINVPIERGCGIVVVNK
ncbi:MAG: hypothetical protein ABI237_06530 [Ginsengibacter sp.]